jgi:hypothetical protein
MGTRLTFVLATVVLLAGCNTGPDIDHYVGVLDTIDIPDDWELVSTQRRGPGEAFDCQPIITSTCPGADRWYALSGDPAAAIAQARLIVEAAGFSVQDVFSPACDGPPSGSLCDLLSKRGTDNLYVSIFTPSRSSGLDYPPDADVIVRVTAQR